MTFQVEMRWRCGVPSCQTEMLGRYKKCSNCGKPKEREPYYDAPGPVTRDDAVTDPALLKQAKAGKDWECPYCGCHERRDSGECRNCGAPSKDSLPPTARTAPPAARARQVADVDAEPVLRLKPTWLPSPGVVAICTLAVMVVVLLWWALSPTELRARVAERQWTHSVHVERYQTVPEEGFFEQVPSDAIEAMPYGTRVHHHDRVPDGYRTESYREPYTCGQTCTKTPVRCSSNDNGFKTCSGGDKSCSPKTCHRNKTRKVRKYRSEPIYQPWYLWKVWRWHYHRTVTESGSGGKVRWPSPAKLALSDRERTRSSAEYTVVFVDVDGEHHKYKPETLPEYQRLAEGKTEELSVGLTGVSIVGEAP